MLLFTYTPTKKAPPIANLPPYSSLNQPVYAPRCCPHFPISSAHDRSTLANKLFFIGGGGGGGFFNPLLTGGGGACFLELPVVLLLRLCTLLVLAAFLVGLTGRSRSSYVYLSGELCTDELVLSAKTSVLTGLRERCVGNGGGCGVPWSDRVRPMRSELGESWCRGMGLVFVRWKTGFCTSRSSR